MSVQRPRPTATDSDERRVDVTGLPAGNLEDFAERADGDVYVERKCATYVVAEE